MGMNHQSTTDSTAGWAGTSALQTDDRSPTGSSKASKRPWAVDHEEDHPLGSVWVV